MLWDNHQGLAARLDHHIPAYLGVLRVALAAMVTSTTDAAMRAEQHKTAHAEAVRFELSVAELQAQVLALEHNVRSAAMRNEELDRARAAKVRRCSLPLCSCTNRWHFQPRPVGLLASCSPVADAAAAAVYVTALFVRF